jgi:hypothetical protein
LSNEEVSALLEKKLSKELSDEELSGEELSGEELFSKELSGNHYHLPQINSEKHFFGCSV